MHLQGDLFNWPICRLHHPKNYKTIFCTMIFLLFRNNKAGPVNLVKLAWKSRSQHFFENTFFDFYIQPGQISEKIFFQVIIFTVLSENTVHCPKTLFLCIFISTLFQLQVFDFFSSMDWFRFQKPLAIGTFWIPRYQDFWDKSLGWFLGFQFIQ